MLLSAGAPNLEGSLAVGEVAVLAPSASHERGAGSAYTAGVVREFQGPAAASSAVKAYLPGWRKSAQLVRLQWFMTVPKAERTFDAHEFMMAAECEEVVLMLEESWVTVEAVVGVAVVWHIEDIEAGTHQVQGMANAFVIAHAQSRKRRKGSPTLRGTINLVAVSAEEWTALPEAKPTASDKLGRVITHTSLTGMRWETTSWLRAAVRNALRSVRGKAASFSIKTATFSSQAWEVLAGGVCAAGGPSTTSCTIDSNDWVELPGGIARRTSGEDTVHILSLDLSRPAEIKAMQAVLGTGWDWARDKTHLVSVSTAVVPLRKTDTLSLIRFESSGKRKRRNDVTFRWTENAASLTVKMRFQRASAGALDSKFALFPGGLA